MHNSSITPIEKIGDVYFKREDLFACGGFRGSKARVCDLIASAATGVTTQHTKKNPQGPMVAAMAAKYNIPCRIHTNFADMTPDLKQIEKATITTHPHDRPLYKFVVADRKITGFKAMPVNMACTELNEIIFNQLVDLPPEVNRIITTSITGDLAIAIYEGIKRRGSQVTLVVMTCSEKPMEWFEIISPSDSWTKDVEFVHPPALTPKQDLTWPRMTTAERKASTFLRPGDLFWMGNTLGGEE